jgi:hypothetical protein
MVEKQKFRLGQRIVLTEKGKSWLPPSSNIVRSGLGIILGYEAASDLVRVKIDGVRTVYTFHSDFWIEGR